MRHGAPPLVRGIASKCSAHPESSQTLDTGGFAPALSGCKTAIWSPPAPVPKPRSSISIWRRPGPRWCSRPRPLGHAHPFCSAARASHVISFQRVQDCGFMVAARMHSRDPFRGPTAALAQIGSVMMAKRFHIWKAVHSGHWTSVSFATGAT